MRALDHKLLRDLWKIKSQALAIALVIVSGVSTFVMFISTMDSLSVTRDTFYADYGFAQVFASLKRAPESVREKLREIPGVDRLETRITANIKLDVAGFNEPVNARLVSIPDNGQALLNRLYIRKGRPIAPGAGNEVIVGEAFAEAHRFQPGDSFRAVINGRMKELRIAGIALSPEFVLQVRPGAISPDYKRYGILWMNRAAMETAYDMKGAFNDVALTVSRGARTEDVITRLDAALDRYGCLGSYGRKDQLSHRYLTEEFRQLQRMAAIFPIIFISVSSFLLNVVVSRLINTQREQIAALKSFGYTNTDVGLHYTKLVILIVLVGVTGGVGVGMWMSRGLGNIYMEFYRFPFWIYTLRPLVILAASMISLASALLGVLHAVGRAAHLPPAEAMRPEPPADYRESFIERIGFGRFISQPTRIILRNLQRRPVKSALSVLGIALACAIMIAGRFSKDAVDFMIDVQFRLSHKEDLTVTFTEPTSRRSLYELRRMPGIEHAEVFRSAPVRLRSGHRSYRTTVQGIDASNSLHYILNSKLQPVLVPPDGLLLTDYLGKMLHVAPGDRIIVEALEANRTVKSVPVVGLVNQYIGISGYMDIDSLNRLLGQGDAVSGVYLTVDRLYLPAVFRELVVMPRVAGTVVRKDEIRDFYETQAEAMLFFTFVATLLAGTVAFGIVYNSARIILSERSRELASLRVLGYTRAEISYILLGELGLLTLAAIIPGFLIGRLISAYMAKAFESDLFRIPLVIEPWTYSLAAAVDLLSLLLSGLIVRRRLDHLDLVAVLKAKE